MANVMLFIFIQSVLFSCLSAFVHSAEDLISYKEAEVGQSVTMRCRINHVAGNEIEWHHTPYGLQKLNAVYLGGFIYSNYRDRFAVTGDGQQGERILKISNVSYEDAGKYICMHDTESHMTELIVFATYPSNQSCAAIIPNDGLIGSNVCRLAADNISITCNYSYRGNLVPAVEWKDGDGSLLQSIFTYRADVNTSTLIHRALKNDTITAQIKYLSSDFLSKFTWKVSIAVQNISHDQTVQKIGCDSQIIHCEKPRLPYQCTIGWKSLKHGINLPNATLYTAELSNSLYTCSAQCNIRRRPCSIQQLAVDLDCPESSARTNHSSNSNVESDSKIVLVVISVIVVVILIATAVLIFVFRKRIMRSLGIHFHKRAADDVVNNPMLRKSQNKADGELSESNKDPVGQQDALLVLKSPCATENKTTEENTNLRNDPKVPMSQYKTDVEVDLDDGDNRSPS